MWWQSFFGLSFPPLIGPTIFVVCGARWAPETVLSLYGKKSLCWELNSHKCANTHALVLSRLLSENLLGDWETTKTFSHDSRSPDVTVSCDLIEFTFNIKSPVPSFIESRLIIPCWNVRWTKTAFSLFTVCKQNVKVGRNYRFISNGTWNVIRLRAGRPGNNGLLSSRS